MIRAEQASQQFRRDRERWAGPISISETELGFLGATASAYIQQQTKGHYPAPLAALELMLGAAGVDVETACQMEADEFAKLFGSPINRALLNVFFLRDRNKKDAGVAANVEPRKIASAGVVGAGVMGQGIAAANVKRGIPVAVMDANQEALVPRRARRAERGRLQQANQRPGRQAGDRAGAARERHAVGYRALPFRHRRRSDHRAAASRSSICSLGSSR